MPNVHEPHLAGARQVNGFAMPASPQTAIPDLKHERLHDLLLAQSAVASELGLQEVLHRVATAAGDLVHARYSALAMLDDHGRLEEFAHTGADDDTDECIGELPRSGGILGRLTTLPRHQRTDGFLGAPIHIRGHVLGAVYLTGSANGEFSAEDEQLVVALATTAGVAIDNARQHEESEQRHRWLTASTAVTQNLFAGQDESPLDMVLKYGQQSASADFAVLASFVESGQLQVQAVSGILADRVSGLIVDMDHSLAGKVARSGTPIITADYSVTDGIDLQVRLGSVIVVPLLAGEKVVGTLSVGRVIGRRALTEIDMAHLAGFANHAGVALELGRVRADQQALRMADEHDRIGAELNHEVIQSIFAVGIGLQGMIATSSRPALRKRIASYVGILDDTIDRIRTTVFDVNPKHVAESLRLQLLDAIDEETATLDFSVLTSFTGNLSGAISPAVADDAVMIIRGALSIVVRHASATRAEARVDVADDLITVEIIDNGAKPWAVGHYDAIIAFRHRATECTGTLTHSTSSDGDTHLTWKANIAQAV